jgi:glycosyltransferase involved in cell wall biosynthesis
MAGNMRVAGADSPHAPAIGNGVSRESAAPRVQAVPALRVLILSRHPEQQGGVVNYLQLLIRRLDPSIAADLLIIGRRPGESGAVRSSLRLCADLARFARAVASGGYDVVHLNPSLDVPSTLRDAAFLLVLKLVKMRRTVVFFRGWDVELERRIARNAVYRRLFRWLFGTAGQVLVLSTRFEDALRRLGFRCPIEVVTTMFDGRLLKQALAETPPRPERPAILYLSRFVREKGVYELIEAFAGLAPRYPDLTLVLAGDGAEANGLKQAAAALGIQARVKFPGYLRGLDKARMLTQARIFVLATNYPEGLPNALLEAMAAGQALITTRIGGIPEVMDDPDNGVLLEEVTAQSIGAALERILSDDGYWHAVRANNMKKAWSRYEAEVVTRRVEEIYRKLATMQRNS